MPLEVFSAVIQVAAAAIGLPADATVEEQRAVVAQHIALVFKDQYMQIRTAEASRTAAEAAQKSVESMDWDGVAITNVTAAA